MNDFVHQIENYEPTPRVIKEMKSVATYLTLMNTICVIFLLILNVLLCIKIRYQNQRLERLECKLLDKDTQPTRYRLSKNTTDVPEGHHVFV